MKTKFIVLFLLMSIPVMVNAQAVKDEIALIQSAFGLEKRAMIEEYMGLPNDSAFWPAYEAYEKERRELMKQRILIINEYLENFDTMTDAKADEIALRTIKNNANFAALHGKHFKKIKKTVSPKDAAKFLQLDTYIQNTILLAISESLPFIGEQ
ncbi:hypothetical protein EF405_17385 [Cyclobacteriaceae bacterium YHN15]|nr:hypothetical protein EF405_17385 [Cyclobacteriaceae bacterium YHN15]